MRIYYDLDDVLVGETAQLLNYYNAKHGTKLKRKDITAFHLSDCLGITRAQEEDEIRAFYQSPYYKHIKPIPGAVSLVKRLHADKHNQGILTARPEAVAPLTIECADLYFGPGFERIEFAEQMGPEGKAGQCIKYRVDVFVEDKTETAIECARLGIKAYLVDCPWNQGKLPDNVTRIYPLGELYGMLKFINS